MTMSTCEHTNYMFVNGSTKVTNISNLTKKGTTEEAGFMIRIAVAVQSRYRQSRVFPVSTRKCLEQNN